VTRENGAKATRSQVLAELRDSERFVLVTHENPDGDALGSLVAMHELLKALGKDSVMFMAADEFPLPYEYRFFQLEGLVSVIPDDVAERTIVFLDCGNIDRNPADVIKRDDAHILNIDHHHDNTHFGTVNHVVPEASCTAEIVWDLMRGLEVEPSQPIAEALYVGLVTDTGKFMYENTGTRAHVMAAELIDAGVAVHEIYHRLYEGIPYGKLELLARGQPTDPAERQQVLVELVGQMERLSTLVGDLIDLARDEEATLPIEDVRLDQVVADAITDVRGRYPRVRFEAVLDEATVRGVRPRIARAVTNLLDNAGKWSPAGGVVEVSVHGGEVSVRDHGPGVAPEDAPRVFDRFWRASNARSLPGSGLGLSIVKDVAESHGGSVSVEHATGGGARFRLRLAASS